MRKEYFHKPVINALLTFLLMVVLLFGTMERIRAETVFSDVPDGKWYTQAVLFCAQKGYVSGYENGSFRPNNKLTRAEMAVIMNRMLNLDETVRNTFSDVPADKWYTNAILHCVKAGIMSGYDEKQFGTNDTLTREQGAVILAKAFHVDGISGRTVFSDDKSISKWAVESVKSMNEIGLISGMGNNMFEPKTPLTRAQMCQIIFAAQNMSGDESKEERTDDVENTTTDKSWRVLQDEIAEEDGTDGVEMVDVDGDDNLELVTFAGEDMLPQKIVTYHNGAVSVLSLNGSDFGYVPGDNIVLTAEYVHNTYSLSIYSIEGKAWHKMITGSFQDPLSGPQVDEEGNDIYVNYVWDGKAVSEEEFYGFLAEIVNFDSLILMGPTE